MNKETTYLLTYLLTERNCPSDIVLLVINIAYCAPHELTALNREQTNHVTSFTNVTFN